MTGNIAIIGAGQLGSRHLQALARIDRPIAIQVVDPVGQSLDVARERFDSVSSGTLVESVEFLTTMSVAPKIDVAIVATTSQPRRSVVEQLLGHTSVDYLILEKFLFPSISDYRSVGELLERSETRAWVNCTQRVWPIYQKLNDLFDGRITEYRATGSQFGIACNGIHFLDHFTYLTRNNDVELDFSAVNGNIRSTSRNGYVDFDGTVIGTSNSGARFEMTSFANGKEPLEISVSGPEIRCLINEIEQIGWIAERRDGWRQRPLEVRIPYQSEITHLVVQEILDTGSCGLTPYEKSVPLHLKLLEPLLHRYQCHVDKEADTCPIT